MTNRDTPPDRKPLDKYSAVHDFFFEDEEDVEGDIIGGDAPECQTCGACCSYSSEWPRFTMESDEALDKIPLQYVAADQRGMRCENERCSALSGKIGEKASCMVYDVRPEVCRACMPGDYACKTARAAFGFE